jgi:hypothetical protein
MMRNTAMLLVFAAVLSASGMDGYTVPGLESQEVLMSIHVWGEVAVPGTYLVPVSSDLIAGISAAGGPTQTASLRDVRILYDDSEIIYDLDSFLQGEGDPVPELMPGATLYLRTRRYEWWKDAVDFTYKLIVTANIIWILFK